MLANPLPSGTVFCERYSGRLDFVRSEIVDMAQEKNKRTFESVTAASRIVKRLSTGEEVSITFGMPKEVAHDRWECLLEIKGLEKAHRHCVRGGDSLQALLMSMQEARFKLEEDGDRFVWLDIEPDYGSGIPRFVPMGMGPRFEQRIEIALERESRRVWEARFKNRKADVEACDAELKQRRNILAGMQVSLERRKAVLADWNKDLKTAKVRRSPKSS
jgi:hypothetical protein